VISRIDHRATLSVVVPCFNEEAALEETHRRLTDVLGRLDDLDYELIYVDDGSRDGTALVLQRLHAQSDRVRTIRFSRNFGHQIAVTAGIEHASGDAIVLIDADLQDPPEVIPEMVARWREGYQVAYGQRVDRAGESAFKVWTAKAFYRLINRLGDVEIPVDTGDFRLMDRVVVDALSAMPEHDRFLRGMVSWVGFRQIAVPYSRASRFAGESKYPLAKMLRFAVGAVTSFSCRPLRLATWLGVLLLIPALGEVLYAVRLRLVAGEWPSVWAAVSAAVLLLVAVQLLSIGVTGEYIGRIYAEVRRRPLYLVQERRGFGDERRRLGRPAERSDRTFASRRV
jgi:polyisoprenyl-phosphate glycosyltransferase